MNLPNNMTPGTSSSLVRRSHGPNSTFDSISDLGVRIQDSFARTEVVLAANEEHRAMTPEELERFGTIYKIKDNGEVVETTGAKMAAERRARPADVPATSKEGELGGQDDSVTEIISPEADRLNAKRVKFVTEGIQREINAAEKEKKRAGAKEKAEKDQAEKEKRLREEASRKEAEKEKRAMQKAEQEVVKRVERAEQAHKTKEARKAAAERRRNFGVAREMLLWLWRTAADQMTSDHLPGERLRVHPHVGPTKYWLVLGCISKRTECVDGKQVK